MEGIFTEEVVDNLVDRYKNRIVGSKDDEAKKLIKPDESLMKFLSDSKNEKRLHSYTHKEN